MNGKSDRYSRPVYIYKKFSKDGAIVVPMTTQLKDDIWHVPVAINGKVTRLALTQIRTISAKRLLEKMGDIPAVYKSVVEKKIKNLL